MAVSVTETLKDAGQRLATPAGAVVAVAFVLFRLGDMIVYRTLGGALVQFLINTLGGPVARLAGYDVTNAEVTVNRLVEELRDDGYYQVAEAIRDATQAGLDLPLWAVLPLLLTLPLIAELLHVLAVRAFAADGDELLPVEEMISGLHVVYFKSLFANFLAFLVIAIGTGFFLLPGLLLAYILFFVRQRVVLDGDGVFAALSKSYGTVKRNLLPVGALFLLLLAVNLAASFVLGAIGVPWFQRVATALIIVGGIAVTTSAYLQTDRDLTI